MNFATPAMNRGDVRGADAIARLNTSIRHAAQLLPVQGPIQVFIAQNILQGFEEKPFDEGVRAGARLYGAQPYQSEEFFRNALRIGRIRFDECRDVLREDLGDRANELVAGLITRIDLRLAMLQFPMRTGTGAEVEWYVAESEALRKVRPEASAAARNRLISETHRWVMRDLRGGPRREGMRPLPAWAPELLRQFGTVRIEKWDDSEWEAFTLGSLWRSCLDAVRDCPSPASVDPNTPVRHRDLLLEQTGFDTDRQVNELLVRLTASFLDQGLAHWSMPNQEAGLFTAFCSLYRSSLGPPDRWRAGLEQELARQQDAGMTALDSMAESLRDLGVGPDEWNAYLEATLQALRGWSGMVNQMASRPDRAARPIPPDTLVDLLAVRLLLERFALRFAAREYLNDSGGLDSLRERLGRQRKTIQPPALEARAFKLFQLAQVLAISPQDLYLAGPEGSTALVREVEAFSGIERRRVFFYAFERRFRNQSLDAFVLHNRGRDLSGLRREGRPRLQVILCMDDREESLRRHLEELDADLETYGTAGFFGAAMYYRGLAEAHFVPLCPIVTRPTVWVTEQVDESSQDLHQRRAQLRRWIGSLTHGFLSGTRTVAAGAILTATVGTLATIPLVLRLLFPRLAGRVSRRLSELVRIPERTALTFERSAVAPADHGSGLGFNVPEMVEVAERLLREIGLVENFGPLVMVMGHGSDSLNNPHKSAYDCGACGGGPGGANARAVALMLNDPRVRAEMASRGLHVPADTYFVGGMHNTCDESITIFDSERVPATHREALRAAEDQLIRACDLDAQERCRRFMSAPLTLTPAEAREHVEGRSQDLAQTRPELGHGGVGLALIGRREWSRGLFLDRRAFLISYDPTLDDEDHKVLAGILRPAFNVAGGINLAYFFSRVDNESFGAGSKLPHNLTSLVGVMDGAASDLRTGLPWQMVEIHEPVRLLMVIETTARAFLAVAEANPDPISRMFANGWVQVALRDPDTGAISVWDGTAFVPYQSQAHELPEAPSSADWFRGWRDYLEFAEVGSFSAV
jgi:uncharacterized protein YbcC (UPF0753/DUF2309 family)